MQAVLDFLTTRTPQRWCELAIENIDTLLLDHATLELKAAHQAQQLIWKYGAGRSVFQDDSGLQTDLVQQMSRLAREELRHFEQVMKILQRRNISFVPLTPSHYAAALHEHLRSAEPDRLIDKLIIGALIEARSCERFCVLAEPLSAVDAELARFYASLMQSEARHFENYLSLARRVGAESVQRRIDDLREKEGRLVFLESPELRLHSGMPTN